MRFPLLSPNAPGSDTFHLMGKGKEVKEVNLPKSAEEHKKNKQQSDGYIS